MKIALASDLHLEFGSIELVNDQNADVLILSGDIMVAEDLHDHPRDETPPEVEKILGKRQQTAKRYRDFLHRCSVQFPHTIYVAGNHEFYHGKWHQTLDYLHEECSLYPNVYFLEDQTKEINDVVFVGVSLWTDMNGGDPLTIYACDRSMNDYRMIREDAAGFRKLRPSDTVHRHKKSLSYIKKTIESDTDKKYIVVGHHSPTKQSVKPEYQNDYHINGAYSSDLSNFILEHPQIKIWTHGHTHDLFDYFVGTTRIVCNPRGYVGYEQCADKFELKFFEI
jgi:Icc-related predicted phosphoesterase